MMLNKSKLLQMYLYEMYLYSVSYFKSIFDLFFDGRTHLDLTT